MLPRSVLYLCLSTTLMAYVAARFSNSGGYANISFTVNLFSLVSADQQPETDGVECEAEVGFLASLLYNQKCHVESAIKKLWPWNYERRLAVPYLSSTELFLLPRSQLKIRGFCNQAETMKYL